MRIPKKLNVFGVEYKIVIVDTDMFAGLCEPSKRLISISKHQSKEQMIHTYIHEAIHAMQFSLSMHQAVSREFMEIMADSTATLILQMLHE
jgi:hypothetical protein